jgi:hypothetical protein
VQAYLSSPQELYGLGDIHLDLGPADAAPTDLELGVEGWPRWASLAAQLRAAVAAEPATPVPRGGSAPPVVQALPYVTKLSAEHAALLVGWSDEYHAALGMQGTVMYVQRQFAAALAAQPRISSLVASGRLALVLWVGLTFYEGWRDIDLQVGGQKRVGG